MTTKTLLTQYADFNRWANTALVTWLRSKPIELMRREMPSSFPTIHETLLHIWGAEEVWLERLNDREIKTFITERFKGDTALVFDGLLKQSVALAQYVESLDEESLHASCAFRLLNGTEDSRPRAHMIHHCLNHSTYHRGQIVTMARNFGLSDPPSTDFIRYLRLEQ